MKIIVAFVILLAGQVLWAHGEAKPGPHKGYIRMPGAFHTEVVPAGKNMFKVYLLDLEWKHPSIKDSKLDIKVVDHERSENVQCQQKTDHYMCKLPAGYTMKIGKLVVNASRESAPGAEMSYDLPLSFNVIGTEAPHNGHH